MKRREKAKAGPKFRVGQVVYHKGQGHYVRVEAIGEKLYHLSILDKGQYVTWGNDGKQLRPLTARESGQRQRKGKRV